MYVYRYTRSDSVGLGDRSSRRLSMKLNVTNEDKICTIMIEGSIDALTSPELEQAISGAAPVCEKMILDMTGVDYISSAGLRTVVAANQKLGKDNLTLKGLAPNVLEIFRLTGFTKFFNIE
jgi:anti-anti-sigma factor